MRFAPKSLAGQLTLLLLLALAAAQGVAVALFAWERMEALRDAHRDDAVLRTATVARLLGDTPPELHDSVITAASTDLARFSLTAEPVVGETDASERAAAIAGDLSSALGVGVERVRVAPLWTLYLGDDDGWYDDHDHDDDDDHDRDGDHDDDGPDQREPDWFTASVALTDGRWLNVAAGPPPGAPAWGPAFVAVFLLSALGHCGRGGLHGTADGEADARPRGGGRAPRPRRGGGGPARGRTGGDPRDGARVQPHARTARPLRP